jgi:ABC-type transport system involved in cytochrome bd biosynthesis fused ATPase/permease subunit
MIRSKLIKEAGKGMRLIFFGALFMWLSSLVNVFVIWLMVRSIRSVIVDRMLDQVLIVFIIGAVFLKFMLTLLVTNLTSRVSTIVRRSIRLRIYDKLVARGFEGDNKLGQSTMTQLAVEGVEHLDLYYSVFVPQVIHGLITPLSVFLILLFIIPPVAFVLILAVPFIPLLIIMVNTRAKKKVGKHWQDYTTLGDFFLDRLMGLSTLKLFNADWDAHQRMDQKAESFRQSTMRVLRMQLNSISIMDLVAYGGAAFAIVVTMVNIWGGTLSPYIGFFVILLSAEFFLPLRALGSAFHVATNGIGAYQRIDQFLSEAVDIPIGSLVINRPFCVDIKDLSYAFDDGQTVLKDINISLSRNQMIALVGVSGSGKSTLAKLLMGLDLSYQGEILISGADLKTIRTDDLMKTITYVGSDQHLFNMSVRDNLSLGAINVTDAMMFDILDKLKMTDFIKNRPQGLDGIINEQASNLSGGEKQRLLLARTLLMDREVYIFDEMTSSVDDESEGIIMDAIESLSKDKMVLLVSHHLLNTKRADIIYVIDEHRIVESGTHEALMSNQGLYQHLYHQQQTLVSRTHGGRPNR